MTTDKRTLLVKTALALFYRHGIHAVGINEVLKTSGVAKKTLYRYFNSKEALIIAAVEQRDRAFMHWLHGRLAGVPAGAASIEAIFLAMDDWFNDRVPALDTFRGCFFINTSAEYSQQGCDIFAACQRHKAAVRQLLLHHIEQSVADAVQAEALADRLLLLKEGAIVTAHLLHDKQAALKAAQAAQQLLLAAR